MTREELQQRTKQFALRVIKLSASLPQNAAGKAIAHQIVRSATSVAANYRAACRARSRAEFSAKLGVVLEEADETQFWLEMITEAELLSPSRVRDLMKESSELVAIFTASSKTLNPRFK